MTCKMKNVCNNIYLDSVPFLGPQSNVIKVLALTHLTPCTKGQMSLHLGNTQLDLIYSFQAITFETNAK